MYQSTNFTRSAEAIRYPHSVTYTTLYLLLIFLMPTFVFYTLGTSSQAPGLIAVFVITIVWAAVQLSRSLFSYSHDVLYLLLGTICFIGIHGMIVAAFRDVDGLRLAQSVTILAVGIISSQFISRFLFNVDDATLRKSILIVSVVILLIAFFGILGVRPYMPSLVTTNPVWPYNEPSHLALGMSPIALALAVQQGNVARLFTILIVAAIGYFLQSMSTVVIAVVLSMILLPLYLIPIVLAAFAFTLPYIELDYFLDRIDLSIHSENISVLVYIQGWELMADALQRTFGWGVGFQQLGLGIYSSPTSDVIYHLLRSNANILDGGFTMAKIVCEFGIFGFLIAVSLIAIIVQQLVRLRATAAALDNSDYGLTLARCMVAGFFVEFLVRGIGYFSPTIYLLFAAIFYLHRRRELI